eukprot:11056708-Lingulodinium_polyedra.AAC.1
MPVSSRHPLRIPTPLLALCETFARAPLEEEQGCRPLCCQCPLQNWAHQRTRWSNIGAEVALPSRGQQCIRE